MPDAPDPHSLNPDRRAHRPEFDALAHALVALLAPHLDAARAGRRVVVGVAGESGCGKSVTATNLARVLTAGGLPTGVLHQDDYFVRPPRTNHAHRVRDIAAVGPHEVHLALLAEHAAAFRAGRDVEDAPLVDYPNDRFVTRRHGFGALRALVVEGTYVLRLPDLDARVFLEATHEHTRERRLARARDAADPFVDRVLAIEHRLIREQAAAADVLVAPDYRARPAR